MEFNAKYLKIGVGVFIGLTIVSQIIKYTDARRAERSVNTETADTSQTKYGVVTHDTTTRPPVDYKTKYEIAAQGQTKGMDGRLDYDYYVYVKDMSEIYGIDGELRSKLKNKSKILKIYYFDDKRVASSWSKLSYDAREEDKNFLHYKATYIFNPYAPNGTYEQFSMNE